MGLIVGPEPPTVGMATHENRWDSASCSFRREQPKISKSATELAVEEHFEKSLAAFNASNRSKQVLLSEGNKANSSGNMIRSPNTMSVFGRSTGTTTSSSINSGCSASFDLSSITSHNVRSNMPCLVRQCAQDHTSPQTGSIYTSTIESPSYTARTPINPGLGDGQSSESISSIRDNSAGSVHSPGENGPMQTSSSIVLATASSGSSTSSASAHNSFKPKKNWLAQYDWRQDARDVCTLSPTTPNGLLPDGLDSAGSSPASIGRDVSDMATTPNHGSQRGISSPIRFLQNKPRNNGTGEHEVSVQTVESVGLSTDDHPFVERKTRHSAEIQTDAQLIHNLSINQEIQPDENSQHSVSEPFTEDTRPRKILLLEKNGQDGAYTQSVVDQTKYGECSTQTGYHPQPIQSKRSGKTLRKDLALSPIFHDHGNNGGTAVFAKSSSNEQSLEDPSDRVSPKPVDGQSLLTQSQQNNCEPGTGSNCNAHSEKYCSHWGLSNSCSPSPAHQDGSATSAVTPVSGTTSGFFTGSTYSLDSSLGTAHTMPFDAREVDSGIDLKSVSEERNFPEHESRPDSDEMSGNQNGTDLPGCAWGMRKRASSEASPWSTLKRSRSVLTSPLPGRATCASCSSSSAELLLDAHGDEAMSTATSRLRRMEGGSHCRCCEGQNRSLTPELNGPSTKPGRDRLLIQPRQNSDPVGTQLYENNNNDDDDNEEDADERAKSMPNPLPMIYPLCKTTNLSSDRKPSSEPPSSTNRRSGTKTIGRSLSDAAALPILHLTNEKEVFVLR
ncbi:unnamed protein product [Echinostoma caproni]|uniref:Protein kinase domain-containing protein n=1 Tax=Echinostoma caproni TaxID=27848 RepID=A0A183ANT3_9TREM|nr:unnamed protein product [Echinostoma caproni]